MRNRIRLTEGQLRRVIKESVKSLLNEYYWNGRTPEEDQASIETANTPASWKMHMLRAQRQQQQGKGYNYGLTNKARDAFHNKYGTRYDYHEDNFDNGGSNSNTIRGTITDVNTTGGRLAFNQRDMSSNGERYHEKTYGDYGSQNLNGITDDDYKNGYVNSYFGGSKNVWGGRRNGSESLGLSHKEAPSTRDNRFLSMSPQFRKKLNDMDKDMDDFYSGGYAKRLQDKRQKLGK